MLLLLCCNIPPPKPIVPNEPNAPLLPNASVPPFIVVPPVYVFTPLNVNTPLPSFVNAVVPVPSCITPLKVVDVPFPPAVNIFDVATEFVTVPAPASDPTDTVYPAISNIPVTVTLLLLPNADPFPAFNVPADTVVFPLYVLTPDNVSVPLPVFVIPVVPVPFSITPLKTLDVLSPPAVNIFDVPLLFVTVPVPDNDPTDTLYPAISNIPVTVVLLLFPNAPAFPAFNVPLVTFVVPVYVFAPLNVNVPVPDFVSDATVVSKMLLMLDAALLLIKKLLILVCVPETVITPVFDRISRESLPQLRVPTSILPVPSLRPIITLETLPCI